MLLYLIPRFTTTSSECDLFGRQLEVNDVRTRPGNCLQEPQKPKYHDEGHGKLYRNMEMGSLVSRI